MHGSTPNGARREAAPDEVSEKEQDSQHGGRVSQVDPCRKAEFDPLLFYFIIEGQSRESSIFDPEIGGKRSTHTVLR